MVGSPQARGKDDNVGNSPQSAQIEVPGFDQIAGDTVVAFEITWSNTKGDRFRYAREATGKQTWEAYRQWNGFGGYYYPSWKKHREDGPAVILPDGQEKWFQAGVLHREDGPASYSRKGVPMYRLGGKKVSAFAVLGQCPEATWHALRYEKNGPV